MKKEISYSDYHRISKIPHSCEYIAPEVFLVNEYVHVDFRTNQTNMLFFLYVQVGQICDRPGPQVL